MPLQSNICRHNGLESFKIIQLTYFDDFDGYKCPLRSIRCAVSVRSRSRWWPQRWCLVQNWGVSTVSSVSQMDKLRPAPSSDNFPKCQHYADKCFVHVPHVLCKAGFCAVLTAKPKDKLPELYVLPHFPKVPSSHQDLHHKQKHELQTNYALHHAK